MSITREDESVIYRYELKINEYEDELMWANDLFANTTLSGNEKIVMYTIRRIIRRVRYDMSEPVLIYMAEISNKAGLHEQTVMRSTKKLNELGLIIKETRGKGENQKTWYSIPKEIRISSQSLATKRNRNWGGTRSKCEKCGSENIDIYTAYECRDCGHIHQADVEHQ